MALFVKTLTETFPPAFSHSVYAAVLRLKLFEIQFHDCLYAETFAGPAQAGMQMQRMLLPLQLLKQQQLMRLVLAFEQGH